MKAVLLIVLIALSATNALPPCYRRCPKSYVPVCGSDNLWHANICIMRMELCLQNLPEELSSDPSLCPPDPRKRG
uniref:Kazal-like domain-containing protein n=1 Tax=Ciona savignyi TaxID=51511 RepID=H2ZPV8_CIOSA